MKTIEEEAVFLSNENVLKNINWNYTSELERLKKKYYDGFKAGVEFAQRWISVEDELPLAVETGEWDGKRSDFVLAKNKWGNVYIARTYEGIIDGNKFCDFAEKDDTIISHIVEWRPIELK